MKKYLIAIGLSLLLAMPVLAINLDSKIEQILIDVAKNQNEHRDKTGYKNYLEIPKTKIDGGYYQVDQYETPCTEGLNPPICYGYQIYFYSDDGNISSQGEGIIASKLTAETYTESMFIKSTMTSTPKI